MPRQIRSLIGSVAVLVVTAIVLGLAGPAMGASERVPMSKISQRDVDVEIFMTVDATNAQIAVVEKAIRRSDDVDRYAHMSKQDAYTEFQRIFARNPDLVEATTAADLPQSFRVQLRDGSHVKRWAKAFASISGVDSANPKSASIPTEASLLEFIHDCEIQDPDMRVFMDVGATGAQIDAAANAVRAESSLTITRVLSKADAYEEFQKIFANKPGLLRQVKPGDLPASIAVHPASVVNPDVLDRLRAIDGVDSVEVPSAACENIRSMLALGYTPEELARLIVAWGKSEIFSTSMN